MPTVYVGSGADTGSVDPVVVGVGADAGSAAPVVVGAGADTGSAAPVVVETVGSVPDLDLESKLLPKLIPMKAGCNIKELLSRSIVARAGARPIPMVVSNIAPSTTENLLI